jgi:hypothetical protein
MKCTGDLHGGYVRSVVAGGVVGRMLQTSKSRSSSFLDNMWCV